MKKLFKKIKDVNLEIWAAKSAIKGAYINEYYKIFNKEGERKADIISYEDELKKLRIANRVLDMMHYMDNIST